MKLVSDAIFIREEKQPGRAMKQAAEQQWMLLATSFAHEYRPDVDGLRAIAVSAVIVHHFYNDLLPGGFLGVDMFFVISGYVITASLAKQPDDSIRALSLGFYSRRIKRLLPALVVCVMATCLLGALFINPQMSEYSDSIKAGFFSLFGLSNIFFFREAADYFGTSTQLNLFTHTWSLGVEEQFYIVFPGLFWISGNASRRPWGRQILLAALGLLTVLSFSVYIWLNMTMVSGAYFLMPPRFWELSIGCMAALVCLSPLSSGGRHLDLAPWLASVLIAIALIAPASQQLYATPAIVVGTAVLIMTLRPCNLLYHLLTLRYVLMVGLMSYSLYLWHWSVLSISRWTVGIHWWSAPVQVAAILSLAALSFVFVERPLRRAEWSTSKLVTIGIALIAVVCSAGMLIVVKRTNKLYTGTPTQMAAKGVETLMDNKWRAGKIQWHASACILSSNDEVGKQLPADVCTLGESTRSKRKFLIVGNSFSAAEFEMYAALSESELGSVTATSTWGASPVPDIPNKTPWSKANAYYWSDVVPSLISRLDNGDVLIMINDLAGLTPATMSTEDEDRLALLRTGLKRLAEELHQKGVQIIFQSTNPFVREAHCTPDMAKRQWFNVGDRTGCTYYTKIYSIKRSRPLLDVLEDVRSTNPNFHILDLFPVLCPEDECRFYDNQGVPLYRDVWTHQSIEANYLARPLFLSVVSRAIKASSAQSLR
jgi:peptidoglycan/LPS O-acetylase OafA/YrhL